MRLTVMACMLALTFPALSHAQSDSAAPASRARTNPNDISITGSNAPLGIDLEAVQTRYPSCRLVKGVPQITNVPVNQSWIPPLTGYDPPFPDLTPTNQSGQYFKTTWQPLGSSHNVTLAVLDWNIVDDVQLWCGPNSNLNETLNDKIYGIIVFNKKVLSIETYSFVKGVTDVRAFLETVAGALPGHRGPTHYAVDPDVYLTADSKQPQQVPVYVTYVDDGDLRTVIQTEGTSQSVDTQDKPDSYIAYVDLPLWKQYMAAVQTDLARMNTTSLQEVWLAGTVDKFRPLYEAAGNDMAKGLVRQDRANALCDFVSLPDDSGVADWIGTISALTTVGDGRGVLAIQISPHVTLTTANNVLSEDALGETTLIPVGSEVYVAAAKLKVGDRVEFSGRFFGSDDDCIQEESLTADGDMMDPEFLFQFFALSPVSE